MVRAFIPALLVNSLFLFSSLFASTVSKKRERGATEGGFSWATEAGFSGATEAGE